MILYVVLILSFLKTIWLVGPFVFRNRCSFILLQFASHFLTTNLLGKSCFSLISNIKFIMYQVFYMYLELYSIWFHFLFAYNVLVPNYLMWKYFYTAVELYLTYYFYFPGYFHVFSLPWGL